MQFIPRGGSSPVRIYAYATGSDGILVPAGSAWRERENMILRIDVYQSDIWGQLGKLKTYTTSDGQDFLTLLLSKDRFMNQEIISGSGRFDDPEETYSKAVGYIRLIGGQGTQAETFKVSLSLSAIKSQMAPSRYGNSMFAAVSMRAINAMVGGVSSVGAISMMFPKNLHGSIMTPCLINRISVSLGSRDDEA